MSFNTYLFVQWLALPILGLSALTQAGTRPSLPPDDLQLVHVSEHVYAFVTPELFGQYLNGNTTVVVGDSAVLVVDSGHFPTVTRRMIAQIRGITAKPVRFVVNTHFHPDHWMGNADFMREYPGVQIVSTTYTRDQMAAKGPRFVAALRDSSSLFKNLRTLIRTDKYSDGSAVTPDERALLEATIPVAEMAAPGWQSASLALPTVTFDKEMSVDLGHLLVRIMFMGRANTGGDAEVYVPADRTISVGDVISYPTPMAYGTFFNEFHAVLEQIHDLDPKAIIPGHGRVERDLSVLNDLIALESDVRRQVHDLVRRGASLEQVRTMVHIDSIAVRFTGSNPDRRREFLFDFTMPGLARAYLEAMLDAERTP